MKTYISSRRGLNDYEETSDNYFYNNAIDRKENYNGLFIDNALESLGEYFILPALINRDFKKFIKEFYSVHPSFNFKAMKQIGSIFIVTVRNSKEKKYENILWYLKKLFLF